MNDDDARLKKLEKDVYLGNGKEPLMVRMALVESVVESMQESTRRSERMFQKIALMVAGVMLTVLGDIVVQLMRH